jgi:hypothetical protein
MQNAMQIKLISLFMCVLFRFDVNVMLVERDFYTVLGERVVDGFQCACRESVMGLYGGIQHYEQVDGAVSEVVQPYVNSKLRVYDIPAELVLLHKRFQGFQDYLTGKLQVCPVFHAYRNLEKLVILATVQVLEVLGEQVSVGKRYGGAVLLFYLGGKIAYALYYSSHTVAGNLVSYTYTASHQLDAVEEVVDGILHGESQAGGKTSGDKSESGSRDVQNGEYYDEEQQPAQHGQDGVGETQVHVVLLEREASFVLVYDVFQFVDSEKAFGQIY